MNTNTNTTQNDALFNSSYNPTTSITTSGFSNTGTITTTPSFPPTYYSSSHPYSTELSKSEIVNVINELRILISEQKDLRSKSDGISDDDMMIKEIIKTAKQKLILYLNKL